MGSLLIGSKLPSSSSSTFSSPSSFSSPNDIFMEQSQCKDKAAFANPRLYASLQDLTIPIPTSALDYNVVPIIVTTTTPTQPPPPSSSFDNDNNNNNEEEDNAEKLRIMTRIFDAKSFPVAMDTSLSITEPSPSWDYHYYDNPLSMRHFFVSKCATLAVVVDVKEGLAGILFYKGFFSNFTKLNLPACGIPIQQTFQKLFLPCTESLFKLACALYLRSIHEENVPDDIIRTIFDATTPAQVKAATSKIRNFDAAAWDAVSRKVMLYAQLIRFKDPVIFDFVRGLYDSLNRNFNIPPTSVFYVEAAGKNDAKWGCGLYTVAQLVNILGGPVLPNGFIPEDVSDGAIVFSMENFFTPKDQPNCFGKFHGGMAGTNYLGQALTEAALLAMQFPDVNTYSDFINLVSHNIFALAS